MMGKLLRRMREWMVEYAYLVMMGCVLTIVAACAMYTQQIRQADELDVLAAAGAPEIGATVQASPSPAVSPLPTIAPLVVRTSSLQGGGVWPVDGAVLRVHDEQTAVYWPMLESWKAHTGLDIAGEAGQTVVCCAEGEVLSCTWDELWGWRVTVGQTDGHVAAYAGLAGVTVARGETVRRGQTLGTLLAKIPCEGELPAHLHLDVMRNGVRQDPEAMLPER